MAPKISLPTSMQAWQHTPTLFSAGPLQKTLKLNQIAAVPQLKKSQTLVKVLSAGLNPVDYKLAELPIATRMFLGSPATPAMDYVGRVWATTLPDTAGVKDGDIVFGKLEPGSAGTLAAYTVVTGTEGLVKAPQGVELDWLGGAATVGTTAYQGLVPMLEDKGEGSAQGKSVLINGGSGGVGTFAIQIAKAIGCTHIVAICSAANADLVKSLGATEVIDYRSTNVPDAAKAFTANTSNGGKFDLILDTIGADYDLYWRSHEFLKDTGRFVQIGAGMSAGAAAGMMKIALWPKVLGGGKSKWEFISAKTSHAACERLGQWMAEGKVKVVLDSTFTMDEVPRAYERLKTGRARGKVVVRVSEDGRGNS